MNNKMREEFEEWFVKEFDVDADYIQLLRDDSSYGYVHNFIQPMWKAWQASRESIVIELPTPSTYAYSYDQALDDCRSVIESAGIKCQ